MNNLQYITQNIIIVIVGISLTLAIVAIVLFGGAYLAMLFWNMFTPYLGIQNIGYWQMWGFMMFLTMISFIFKAKVTVKQ